MSDQKMNRSSGVPRTFEFATMESVSEEPIPTIVVDGYWGVLIKENTVRVNLMEEKYDIIDDVVRKHLVARLVIPYDSFEGIVDGLSSILADARKQRNAGKE